MNELQQLIYNERKKICDECISYETCKQDLIGIAPIIINDKVSGVKCDKARGGMNTNLILDQKYMTVECNNKKELFNQLKQHHTLYIHSKPALGKTHFLYYLANLYNGKGKDVYINLVQNCMLEIREIMFNKKEATISSVIKKFQTVDVLLLDDLGNERASDWTLLEVLQAIIDYRYINNKITIISSNHKPDELFKLYNNVKNVHASQIAPIISRLKDMGVIEYKSKYWRNL